MIELAQKPRQWFCALWFPDKVLPYGDRLSLTQVHVRLSYKYIVKLLFTKEFVDLTKILSLTCVICEYHCVYIAWVYCTGTYLLKLSSNIGFLSAERTQAVAAGPFYHNTYTMQWRNRRGGGGSGAGRRVPPEWILTGKVWLTMKL